MLLKEKRYNQKRACALAGIDPRVYRRTSAKNFTSWLCLVFSYAAVIKSRRSPSTIGMSPIGRSDTAPRRILSPVGCTRGQG